MAADDPTFTILAENQAHADVAFVKVEDAIGKPLFEVFPDTTEKFVNTGVSDLVESFRKVIRTGKPDTMSRMRYDLMRPDGTVATKYWQLTHYPLFQGKGKARQLYAIFQATEDITETVLADQQLADTRRELDSVQSAGLIGTWAWDITNNIVKVDKYIAGIFGVPAAEAAQGLPLETFMGHVHSQDQPRIKQEIETALKSSGLFNTESRIVGGDGKVSWVISRGRIEQDKTGKPIMLAGVMVDITERKFIESNLTYLAKASAALSASLDYHATLQTIADLMIPEMADWCTIDMLSQDGKSLELVALAHKDPAKITWARNLRKKQGPAKLDAPAGTPHVIRTGNPEFYPKITDEMLVASAKSAAELKILRDLEMSSVIIVPLIVDGHGIGAISMITTGQKRFYNQSDLEMANELASRASLAIYNARLFDEAQHELHERTKLEARLKQANDELEHRVNVRTSELEESNISLQRSNQELQDFAYVASHDLQEPLRKIQAFGNLLETEYADKLGDGADYLKRMRNAAARMSILIEDILAFSRVTTKGREFTPVNLHKITKEVLEDLEVRVTETRATIQVGELPTIHADAMQIRQLLQNLIANSLKFHRKGVSPVISISAAQTTLPGEVKACRIEVKDNGMGFDEKYLGRIFAVFQRLHGRETYEGTGIGLAVCRKIVERHGGVITARSKPDKGSTFIITLPLRHKKGDNLL